MVMNDGFKKSHGVKGAIKSINHHKPSTYGWYWLVDDGLLCLPTLMDFTLWLFDIAMEKPSFLRGTTVHNGSFSSSLC